jgi:hypothetical protein
MDNGEVRKLRAALARRQRGRGKRYSANLRHQIGEAAAVLRGTGHGAWLAGDWAISRSPA